MQPGKHDPKPEPVPHVMLVDGMALLFRAYYATSYGGSIRRTSCGVPTNAIFGFLLYLFDALTAFRPSHVVCCWDMGGHTFRTDQFAEYKGNRAAPPADLVPQFDLIREVTDAMGIASVGIAGYEADDCIGTLASGWSAQAEVSILTGDHDMLQLVSERVKVAIMAKGKGNYTVYTLESLASLKQLTPAQVVDLKGFMGDASDNYPGVKGIGEKTALKLLLEYGSIEGVLDNLDRLPTGVRSKIAANLDMLHLSRDLARIRLDVPLACDLAACDLAHLSRETALCKLDELELVGLGRLLESTALLASSRTAV
jgi:5'-3' exonuclease